MTLSSIEVWQKIAAAGLATPAQCRRWATIALEGLSPSEAADGDVILRRLTDLQLLTNYQTAILTGKSTNPLTLNGWYIRQPLLDEIWRDWFEVSKPELAGDDVPIRWSKWIEKSDLTAAKSNKPSLPRAIQLANLAAHPNVQRVLMPETTNGQLVVQVAPIVGGSLVHKIDSLRASSNDTQSCVEQLASALAHLHSSGIVHSRVMPDRVYWNDGKLTLALDPICNNCNLINDATQCGVLGASDNDGWSIESASAHFLAPEFAVPAQQPTFSSDVYSLGATWLWMLSDSFVTRISRTEAVASATQGRSKLIRALGIPEPLARVLKHSLAANPSQRFANAAEFLRAFQVAKDLIADSQKASQSSSKSAPRTAIKTSKAKNPTEQLQAASVDKPTANVDKELPRKAKSPKPVPSQPSDRIATTKTQPVTPNRDLQERETEKRLTGKPATKRRADPQPRFQENLRPARESTSRDDAPVKSKGSSVLGSAKPKAKQHPSENSLTPKAANLTVNSKNTAEAGVKASPAASQRPPSRKRKSKKSKNKWMLPVFGSAGFLVLLLSVLHFSGALTPSTEKKSGPRPAYVPPTSAGIEPATPVSPDPLAEHFVVIGDSNDHAWAPPFAPDPFLLNYLPPGAGAFVALRPATWQNAGIRELLDSFPEYSQSWENEIRSQSRLQLEQLSSVVIAMYPPAVKGAMPNLVYRFRVADPSSLESVRTSWSDEASAAANQSPELLSNAQGASVYFGDDTDSVFSVGPTALMNEVADLGGSAGPLYPEMEKLWQQSSQQADLNWIASASFLLTEGRAVLQQSPERLRSILNTVISRDAKAVSLMMNIGPSWFSELKMIGTSDQVAARAVEDLRSELTSASTRVEKWFVQQTPHPHWRALAFRYPQMLRTVNKFTRFGVEDGVAVANFYLPSDAAPNVLLTSWIAVQDAATVLGDGLSSSNTSSATPLTDEAYLARPIRLNFTQEPIEVALQLIADEANDALPAGTNPIRFELDGDAFEADGITRNQQIKDFDFRSESVRTVLTDLARRGNPVPGAELQSTEQKLIWVLREAEDAAQQNAQAGVNSRVLTLTTRSAAAKAGWPLPSEFATR